jgi:hypothetical protein
MPFCNCEIAAATIISVTLIIRNLKGGLIHGRVNGLQNPALHGMTDPGNGCCMLKTRAFTE